MEIQNSDGWFIIRIAMKIESYNLLDIIFVGQYLQDDKKGFNHLATKIII